MIVFRSSDASAPTLQGVVGGAYSSGWADGSLLNLLDKCLVTGYGAGDQAAGAGWTRSFTGTSKGVFRQGSGCQFYLRVLDDGGLTAGAREAQLQGAEVATDVDTLTNLFPTAAQQATGIKVRKSDTADSVQRSWVLFADNKTFYLFVFTGFSTAYYAGTAFGDYYSFKSGDAYNCMIIGRVTSAILDSMANEVLDLTTATTPAATAGHYMARGYNGVAGAVQFGFFTNPLGPATSMGNSSFTAIPNPEDNKLYLIRNIIADGVTTPVTNMRGYMRGFWNIAGQASNMPNEYDFQGTGGLAGRTFRILGLRGGASSASRYIIETSASTWD